MQRAPSVRTAIAKPNQITNILKLNNNSLTDVVGLAEVSFLLECGACACMWARVCVRVYVRARVHVYVSVYGYVRVRVLCCRSVPLLQSLLPITLAHARARVCLYACLCKTSVCCSLLHLSPPKILPKLLFQPQLLSMLDLSFNGIKRVDADLLTLTSLQILYLHGNHIKSLSSVSSLAKCHTLKGLTLHGNDVEEVEGYRVFVLQHLPRLTSLDFTRITPGERSDCTSIVSRIAKAKKK